MSEEIDKIYAAALRIRLVEEAIAREYPKQEMKSPTHLHIGQEAIPAGFCSALEKKDAVYGYYRSHGWYLAKGGNLDAMIAELHGRATGCSKGYGGSMHLIDLDVNFTGTTAIVAGAMPHAVGGAFTFKARKTDRVALNCFGDAATEEGVFQESLMFAALHKLPVIFVCENNGLATNTWIKDRQPPVPIHVRAAGFGVHSELVDGNNGLEVYRAAEKAVQRARGGGGPSFIECTTYRLLEHCGPNTDFDLGHRRPEEAEPWKARDPIRMLEEGMDPQAVVNLRVKIEVEIRTAFERARRAGFPRNLTPEGFQCL